MAFFMRMRKHIPNIITSFNLLSGCIAALLILESDYSMALLFVIASGLFDFFDGMVARLLRVHSPMGKELDSLADVISFGFVPSLVMFTLLQQESMLFWLPYLGFFIVIMSAWRLAKFNIDERQSTDFIGLNTPMNTFFIFSLPFIREIYPQLFNSVVLVGVTLVTGILLISEIRLFSMKLSGFAWKENKFRFLFLLFSLLSLLFLKVLAIPLILAFYFLFSFLHFSQDSISSKED